MAGGAGDAARGVVRSGARDTTGGVVGSGAGDATGGSSTGNAAGGVVRSGSRNTAGGVVRASAGDTAGGVVGSAARNACSVRAGEAASGRRPVTSGCQAAIVRVYAWVGFVGHVRGVRTGSRVGAVGVGSVGGVGCTVGLVDVRVAGKATVGASDSAVRASKATMGSRDGAVSASNTTVRASQAGAARGVAVRTIAVLADRKAACGRNGTTVLETLMGTADETTGLPSSVVESVRVEAAVVVVGVGGGVSGGVSGIAVSVAVVARVRVHSGIELVEHVRVVRTNCLVVLHLLGLRLDTGINHISGVARMGTQSVRCWAGRAMVLSSAVWARARAVQGSVGVCGGAGVRLTAAEVGVARRGTKGSSRGAVAGSMAARADSVCELTVATAYSANSAVIRVNPRVCLVGHVRGMRS